MTYPIYIPSKGRADISLTAKMLNAAKLPFHFVVEKHEWEEYQHHHPSVVILTLPEDQHDDLAYSRNLAKHHAASLGAKFHWQMDDDIADVEECLNRKSVTKDTESILTAMENFVDSYTNVVMAGMDTSVFGRLAPEYRFNQQVGGCFLQRSDLPFDYAPNTMESFDYNLQVLSAGFCTVRFGRYMFRWRPRGSQKGGYTEDELSKPKQLQRQLNTMSRWPRLLTKMVDKDQHGHKRVVTNHVWRQFKQQPVPVDLKATSELTAQLPLLS